MAFVHFCVARDSIRIIQDSDNSRQQGLDSVSHEALRAARELRRASYASESARTDRNVISVRISKREILGVSVRIHSVFTTAQRAGA